jgi:hypothetical protein
MAGLAYGTLSTLDTLRTNFQTVAEYGEDRAYDDFSNLLAAHNALWTEIASDIVDFTTDRQRRYGSGIAMVMEEVDEFGSPHAQRVRAGSNVGFPLKLYQAGLQWTRKNFQTMTVSEFAAQVDAMFAGDRARLIMEVKKALFSSTNYTTNDPLVDNLGSGLELAVKRLVNADSAEIPIGPNGVTFDAASHTHYLYGAAFNTTTLDALIKTVAEHYASGTPVVYINQAQAATATGLSGFTKYLDGRLMPADNVTRARSGSLKPVDLYNRALGIYDTAEVWVKPWVPANYQLCFIKEQPKPLCLRTRVPGAGLELVSESESHPLRARIYEREFGVGVWNRTNGAITYSNSGSAYSDPSISSVIG